MLHNGTATKLSWWNQKKKVLPSKLYAKSQALLSIFFPPSVVETAGLEKEANVFFRCPREESESLRKLLRLPCTAQITFALFVARHFARLFVAAPLLAWNYVRVINKAVAGGKSPL